MKMFHNWNRWLLASVCLASAVLVTPSPVVQLYQREGYFNGSAYIRLLSSLSLKSHIGLSFRTCHGGELFSQSSAGNNVSLVVGNDGLLFSISLHNKRYESRLGADLLDNTWHTVNIIHRLGNLTLSTAGHQQVVANSTFNSEILQYAGLLSEKSVLIVGRDFLGCILNGPGIIFNTTNMEAHNIEWGKCPLNTNSCAEMDHCFNEPCKGHGTCISKPDRYECLCTARYAGKHCEIDNGSPCVESRCQNGGRCEEDATGDYTCICDAGHTGQHCETEVSSHLCENNPCLNGGSCNVSPVAGRYCTCRPGYTGSNCETNVNECLSNPCQHGGACVDGANDYTCDCGRTGYQGHNCEVNINECENSPCINGKCFDTYGSYTCECAPGYGGSNCEQNLDECSSTPCQHNGVCKDLLGRYQCTCQPGYNGPNCEHNIDDCEGNVCPPNSVCLDGINSFQCSCKMGFIGYPPNCTEVNSCQSLPCLNGGSCNDIDGTGNSTCTCPLGFTGFHCELPQRGALTDWCSTQPCHNGGTCLDSVCHCAPAFTGTTCDVHVGCAANPCEHATGCEDYLGGYACICDPGWKGQNCNEPDTVFDCLNEPCQNAGTCFNAGNSLQCKCRPGFTGKMCQFEVNECDSSPCLNGGVCIDQINGYVCNCSEDYVGADCETVVDACATKPCRNGATCIGKRGRREYRCQCSPGFEGQDCQTNVDDCAGISCPEGRHCVDGINSYDCRCLNAGDSCTDYNDLCANNPCGADGVCRIEGNEIVCTCSVGYEGRYCDKDIDECALNETLCHSGICRNKPGGYECFCRPGYSGDHCQLDINECLTMPCNHGNCTDRVNMFECTCFPGYTGKVCNEDIDECASSPCAEGSTCEDGIDTFSCLCPAGLDGERCETNINECESSPCQNGGICLDEINAYFCNCSGTGFEGMHCEQNIDDCLTNVCENGGTCVDLINEYRCDCYPAYTGKNCSTDIPDCDNSPCQFGGTCIEFSDKSLYHPIAGPVEGDGEEHSAALGRFDTEFSYANANGYACVCVPGVEGENCQKNIDECESSPCHSASKCVDGVGTFSCECSPGYEGTLCDIEIDECDLLKPCVYGECFDKLADYQCNCQQGYGGKNCSEKLTGCDGDPCLNNGTCKPYLENETKHKFNCTCSNGYNGDICDKITTMSLDGEAYVMVNTTRDVGYDIQFRFRTTLPNGVVALGRGLTYYVLGLVDGRLNLHSSLLNKWEGVFIGSGLNNSQWHKVFVAINSTHLVMAANEEQTIYPIDRREDYNATHTSFPTTYLGGAVPNLRKLSHAWPHFTGCMEDIIINENSVLPNDPDQPDVTNPGVSSPGVTVGCPRVEQCHPNPCQNAGVCTDRWRNFVCECARPYLGHHCQYELTPATFGYENTTDSLVTVAVDDAERKAVRSIMDISMFVRTRQERGDIFHMGTSDSPNKTFIAANLEGGELGVKIQFNGNNESYTVGGVKLSDGNNHLIQVVRNVTLIQVKINGTEYFRKTISATGQLDVQELQLGRNFKGVIQDVQIRNGSEVMVVQFYSLEAKDLDPLRPFGQVLLHDVLEGVRADNSCRAEPCMSKGTCRNIWNDYICDCLPGSKGKNCQEMEFCTVKYCPPSSVCRNLDDGYECVANMTFDGINTTLDYDFNIPLPVPEEELPPLNTVEINYRSQTGGTLMHISSEAEDEFVSVSVYRDQVTVAWKLDNATVGKLRRFHKESDGNWSSIVLTVKEDGSISGGFKGASEEASQSFVGDGFPLGAWEDLIRHGKISLGSGAEIRSITDLTDEQSAASDKHSYAIAGETTVGDFATVNPMDGNDVDIPATAAGAASAPLASLTGSFFKGCLGEVRIGNFLLPFFTSESLRSANDTGTDYFQLQSGAVPDENVSCVLCFENECRNNGTCADPSESYVCSCAPGFQADDCSIDIDECLENECKNEAVCVDGTANYTCQCALGWDGWLCDQDIDECASNPCQNNGSCLDLLGSFQCNCTEEFMGEHCEYLKPITCENMPCRQGSTCANVKNPVTSDNFTCTCVPGYEGSTCDVAYCDADPCRNGGVCDTSDESPRCRCPDGFTGRHCEVDIDECAPGPDKSARCLHKGHCIDGVAQFTCDCSGTGFEGSQCERDVDECETGEAQCGQGRCVNNAGGYNCACDQGACGTACQFTDPCSEEPPCQNDGKCTPLCVTAPNFLCECTEGWTGPNCTDQMVSQGSNAIDVAIIVAPIVGALILIGAISVSFFVSMARKKRATRGTYSPSSQEYCNPRVEMDNVMKPPPEERLI